MTSDTELKAAVETVAKIIDRRAWEFRDRPSTEGHYGADEWGYAVEKAQLILTALPSLQQGAANSLTCFGEIAARAFEHVTHGGVWEDQSWDVQQHYIDFAVDVASLYASPPTPASVGADWLGKACYLMSEPHLSGYRVILGFNNLNDAQDAQTALAKAASEVAK